MSVQVCLLVSLSAHIPREPRPNFTCDLFWRRYDTLYFQFVFVFLAFANNRPGKGDANRASTQNDSPGTVPDWGRSLISTIALFSVAVHSLIF